MAGKREQTVALTIEDLIDEVAIYCELSDETAKKVVFAMFSTMIRNLRDGEDIRIRGFGRFYVKMRPAMKKYNSFCKYSWVDPEHNVVYFTPAKQLRYMVNPHLYKECVT
jgi:DNA-binding protein HU-beta